jgi:ssRNA-specific RNase YbeY (16S rRNA maturation enzyme)
MSTGYKPWNHEITHSLQLKLYFTSIDKLHKISEQFVKLHHWTDVYSLKSWDLHDDDKNVYL